MTSGYKSGWMRERSWVKGAAVATGTGVARVGDHVTIGGARGDT
jgi:hypothetical protein